MPHADFVHLHVHSAYSLSEGAIKAEKIPALAHDANMPAVAITDTANLFGALEFSQACAAKGIQPIIGCQIALARADNPRLPPDPIVLLAQDATGLDNLQRLSSRGFLETDPGLKPQLALDAIARACRRADPADRRRRRTAGAPARAGAEAGGRTPARAARGGVSRPRGDGTAPPQRRQRTRARARADRAGGRVRRAAGRHQRLLLRHAGHVRGARRAAGDRRGTPAVGTRAQARHAGALVQAGA